MSTKAKLAYAIPIFVIIAVPYVAFAAIHSNVWDPNILKGPLVTCTGDGSNGVPCQNLCDLIGTAANVIYFGIGVVIWIVAPIMIAWSGIRLMLSRGNPEGASGAKKMITSVVIGLLIVLCAYLIVATFVSVLGISGVGGFGSGTCVVQPAANPSSGSNTSGNSGSTIVNTGSACTVNSDCPSNVCLGGLDNGGTGNGTCAASQSGSGGSSGGTGNACTVNSDCPSNVCLGGLDNGGTGNGTCQ